MQFTTSGVDPGLIHTGIVTAVWDTTAKSIHLHTSLLTGCDPADIALHLPLGGPGTRIWVEDYRVRSSFNTDVRMLKAVQALKAYKPSIQLLNNMGVKKIVTRDLMEVFQLWAFNTPTHHQDLRSAARIMLYGMLKTDALNGVITQALLDRLDGHEWNIIKEEH